MSIFARILGNRSKADPLPTPKTPERGQLEEVFTAKKRVNCDGPTFSRHPRVYLNMGNDGRVYCPYCSRTFVYDAKA